MQINLLLIHFRDQRLTELDQNEIGSNGSFCKRIACLTYHVTWSVFDKEK